jgi:hypothetical protein
MTVQNPNVKNVYEGNGSTTVFPYTFQLDEKDADHVKVYVKKEDTLSERVSNVKINTKAKTVTYPTGEGSPLPAGSTLVVVRETPYTQELNLENQGAFFAEDIETNFDRVVMMIQQLLEKLGRCVMADIGSGKTVEDIQQAIHEDRLSANSSAENAAESARKAAESEGNAKNAASLAGEQANKAKDNADRAEAAQTATAAMRDETQALKDAATNAATAAERSAGESANSARSAQDSENHSGALKTNAEQSATEAKLAAQQAADSAEKAKQIAGGDFATPKQVDEKIAALVNQAPDTLNTLSEIATALGNDPNFATTITNLLGQKLDKTSPAKSLEVSGTQDKASLKTGAGILVLQRNGNTFEMVPTPGANVTVGTAQNCTGNAATATTAQTSGEATIAHGIPVGDKGGNIWIA